MNRCRKVKIALALLAIFLAGTVTGFFGAFHMARHFRPSPGAIVLRLTQRLQTRLKLTPEQTHKIQPIISNSVTAFGEVMVRDMSVALTNCGERVAEHLTPDQKAAFEQMQKEQSQFLVNMGLGGPATNSPVTKSGQRGH